MSDIRIETGKRIRHFRKSRNLTLEELANALHKSKSTVSKYENGDISIDLDLLYELASVLRVHPEQLLPATPLETDEEKREICPAFFQGLNRFYACFYDGRNGTVNHSVLEIFSRTAPNRYKIAMYMNYKDLENYRKTENTYWGYIEHFDALSIIELTHQSNPMEKASVQILASFQGHEAIWGLWNGISSRPVMPVAVKMLFSKKPLTHNTRLLSQLKIDKEDIRRLKYYNFFSVL